MAHKPKVRPNGNEKVGHEHCPDCGSCLIGGYTQKSHSCDARPVDVEVLRVMLDDMRATDEKSRLLHRVPDGFQDIGVVG